MRDKLLPLLLAAAVLTGCAHQTATTRAGQDVRRYTVMMSATPAGKEIVTTTGHEVTVDYEFNDRGRGPKLHSVMTLDEHSIPVAIHTTGNDYFKAPVEERFSIENGTAIWKNASEDSRADAGGFYLAIQAPPELIGLLAKAYLANPAQPLALLPSGTASVRKAGEMMAGDQHITHYEISGLDLTPLDVWLDDQNNLFGFVSPFQSMIREGYESQQKAMQAKQDVRSTERLVEIAQRNTHTPRDGALVVYNARIFNPVTLKVSQPSTIAVEGNRITHVSTADDIKFPGEEIDAGGKLVLPGLWDMHSHLSDTDGVLDIASGVTGVHDVGNGVDFIVRLRKQFDEGTLIGPRIWMRAIIDGPGPMQAPTDLLVSNEADARAIIDRIAALGYEGIKIYSSVKPELVPFMTSYAHSKGLRASGHIPAHMTASQAIDAGYDEIHHINMIMLNFWPDVTETNTPVRFTAVGERAPGLDIKSAEVQSFITKLRTTDTTVDPTLVVFEGMFVARPGVMSPAYAAVAERMPPQLRRALSAGGGLPVTAANDAQYKATFRKMMELTAELHRSGVRLVSGTDQAGGFALHRELELYAEAGIPNAEVLRIATLNSVMNLGLEKDLGTVSAGKYADFIIVDGDPLTNMRDIRNVVTVVKDGKVFDSKKLYAEMGVR